MEFVFQFKESYTHEDLLKIVEILRGENGCPWDRQQTHETLRKDLLEETYEVADAIDCGSKHMLCEELGDLLLQIVLHTQISKEEGFFDFQTVSDGICKKLIQRHPHVFGDCAVASTEEVLKNWDAIKQEAKGQTTYTQTLESVPKAFPALMRMQKLEKRARKAFYSQDTLEDAFLLSEKLLRETKDASQTQSAEEISELLGNLIFSLVKISHHLGVDLEESSATACDRFIDRFSKAESQALETGISIQETYSKTM